MPAAPSHSDWLAESPFTLNLSAGFFGFYAHCGVLLALAEAGLEPRRVVGVSAGALCGGLWAAGLPTEELARQLLDLRRQDFWDPSWPLGGWLRGARLRQRLEILLSDLGPRRLEEFPKPFVAVARDLLSRRTLLLDRGSAALAIHASCALPLLFRPVRCEGRWLVDGGWGDALGLSALSQGERALVHELPVSLPGSRPGFRPSTVRPAQLRLRLDGELPRVHPWRLDRGRAALEQARAGTTRWLREPMGEKSR